MATQQSPSPAPTLGRVAFLLTDEERKAWIVKLMPVHTEMRSRFGKHGVCLQPRSAALALSAIANAADEWGFTVLGTRKHGEVVRR